MHIIALITVLAAMAPDAREQVRQAEIGFAKAFVDRDQAKFFSYVPDDTTFMSARRTLRGKPEMIEVWSNFFKGAESPFSWGPDRVVVSADGKLGFTNGPIYDADGKHAGFFFSTWRKQADGTWLVIFDGPGYPPAPLTEPEKGFVTTEDGVKLHYRKTGGGPLTLIVPLDFALFDDFRQFADIATVITYDPRNRGQSSHGSDPATWTIEQDVKDLEAVRRHFNVERFVPIGFSYFGRMVAMYAQDHPLRVSRVVQLGPVTMGEVTRPGAARTAPAASRETCETQWVVIRNMLVAKPEHAKRIDTSFCALENEWPVNVWPHMASIMDSMHKAPLTRVDLAKVTMPVLTIHGTEDRNAPYTAGREWAATLPDARLVTVKEAAHQSWADDPVTVFGSIRAFLRNEWPLGSEKVSVVRATDRASTPTAPGRGGSAPRWQR